MVHRYLVSVLAAAFLTACDAGNSKPSSSTGPDAEPPPDIAHYDMSATFTDGAVDAVARVTLPADLANAGPSFILGKRFAVDVESSVPADIAVEDYDKPVRDTNLITVDLHAPATTAVELVFRYDGPLNQDLENTYTTITGDKLELRLDMMWFPVFRDLNLQFSLDAAFEGVDPDFVPVSQGEVARDGDAVHVRRALPDMDIPFVAARDLTRFAAPGLEVYAADYDWIVTDILRRHAITAVAFLQDWFGELPDGDVRLVILPEASGAYARRGYIVTGDAREEVEKAGLKEVPETGPAKLVAHEFAHAWWASGDPLTEHRWLSESIAEYASLRYVESTFGLSRASELLERKRESALGAPPLLGTGAVDRAAIYDRGPHLLFDLEDEIGRPVLDDVLGRLARKPPRNTGEFMEMLREIAGAEAAGYFDARLRSGPGPWDPEDAENGPLDATEADAS